MEELRKLQEQLLDDQEVKTSRNPFQRFFINYDPEIGPVGSFALGGEKDEAGNWTTPPKLIDRSAKIIFLKEYGQYTYYDPSVEKITIRSNIFPKWQAKEAVDLATGEPITKMKEVNPDIRYTQITLILVNVDGNWIPAVWYLRGAALKAYLDMLREKKLRPSDYFGVKILEFVTEKKKKGQVVYYVPVLSNILEPSEKDAKVLLSLIPKTVEEFRAYIHSYNGTPELAQKPVDTENDEGMIWSEEDELQF